MLHYNELFHDLQDQPIDEEAQRKDKSFSSHVLNIGDDQKVKNTFEICLFTKIWVAYRLILRNIAPAFYIYLNDVYPPLI